MEEVIDEGHEGDAEDGEVTVVFLFEVSEHGFVLDVDGLNFLAFADYLFELVGLNFSLIHLIIIDR